MLLSQNTRGSWVKADLNQMFVGGTGENLLVIITEYNVVKKGRLGGFDLKQKIVV